MIKADKTHGLKAFQSICRFTQPFNGKWLKPARQVEMLDLSEQSEKLIQAVNLKKTKN